MSVYKKKNSPFFHYDFVWRGSRFFGTTGCTSERLARQFEARVRHDALFPSRQRPPITLDEACGLYQDHAEKLPSWPTIRYMLAELIAGLGAGRALSDIGQRDLIAFVARRRHAGSRHAGQGKVRANSSVNREIENARAVWRCAHAARFDVGEMPDWGKLRLKTSRTRWRVLGSGAEQSALVCAVREDIRDAVRFLLISGWRRVEMLGLKWSDLDLPNRTAWTTIKGGDQVERPLTAEMLVIIANQPRGCEQVFTYLCRRATNSNARRAPRREGQRYPLTKTVLRDAFEAARTAAGVETLRLHDLRHTRATRLLRATGNLAVTQAALAHRSPKTTLKYAHVMNDDIRAALDASEPDHVDDSRTIPEATPLLRRKA